MGTAFERLINKRVKILFKDGDELRVKHGTLISAADGFVTIETKFGICAIKISEAVKIQQTRHPTRDAHE